MKKIGLYLGCDPSWGGTFQYALSLLHTLDQFDKEGKIKLIIFYENKAWKNFFNEKSFDSSYVSNTIVFRAIFKIWRHLHLPISLWRLICDYFHPIARVLRNQECDLWFFPSQDQLSYFGSYNAVTAIHDLMHRYESRFPEVGNEAEYKYREFHYKNICKYSYKILVDSEVGKNHVSESYGLDIEKKIQILPYIIPDYLNTKTPDDQIHNRLNIPENYFFYPAQFWEHKNHKNLIKAFARLKEEFPEVGLVLSGGKKNGYDSAIKLAQELGVLDSITFTGYVSEEEIIALYKKTRGLVMPTFFGPTNIPPLEALAFGVPVIYSKIYGYNEFLKDEAIFVNPESPEDITEGMINVLKGKLPESKYDSLARKKDFRDRLKKIIF